MQLMCGIPTMLSREATDYLRELGRQWAGRGVVVECGSWLGGSMAAIAHGLVEAGYDRPLYAFDRWEAQREEVAKAAACGVDIEEGQNIEPEFRANVTRVYPTLCTCRGRIERATWPPDGQGEEPIEVFLLDAAKQNHLFVETMRTFGPSWIPGVTTIGLMDCFFYRDVEGPKQELYRGQELFVEQFADRWSVLQSWPDQSPLFLRYEKPIDFEAEV